MTAALLIAAYLVIGLVAAAIQARMGGKYEEPGGALFLMLVFWPFAIVLGLLSAIAVAFGWAARMLGYQEAPPSYGYF